VSRRSRPFGALVFVVAVSIGLTVATPPAVADDYPSWQDVEAAKHNEAAKKAEITKINALIAGLENEAAVFAKRALEKGEEYNQAIDALAIAETKADSLQSRADSAQKKARESEAHAGELIANLSRMGGNDLSVQLLVSGSDVDELLYRIGAMDKLAEQSARIYEQATVDLNLAKALSKQAAVARKAHADLAQEAKRAYEDAELASKEAAARAANQQAVYSTLYAQLGSLKGTTAATEKAYLEGLAWEAAQNAIKNPPAPPPPVNPTPPPPNTGVVGGAIAFAQAQVGDPYVIAGSGPNAWDCSGLTKASYASVGVYIGTHSSNNQWATMAAAGRLVPFNDVVAGDLLFYATGGSVTGSKYHVTLYVGNGLMIEAPYPGVNVRLVPVRYGDLVPYTGRPTP
jgi:peptidoglycan DL-endopeptidase CwlO